MTSIDPSHIPWLARTSDPTTGGAVHTTVPTVTPETAALKKAEADNAGTDDDEEDSNDDDDDDDAWYSKRRAQREDKKQAEQAEAARRGLIGLELPIPDARFEQGYLMSIRPFIRTTSTPVPRRPKGDSTPRRESVTRDKRRRLEESLALVEDPASRTGSGINDIFSSNPRKAHQQVTIDWKSIFHVTLRDHLFWPLISGVAWTFGGLLWGGFASYRAAKQAAAKQWEPSSWSENSGNTMWSYVITPWSRLMERYEN